MDSELGLNSASRERLLEIIAEQVTTIGELQKQIEALKTHLAAKSSPGMPGNKAASTKPRLRKATRKRRAKGFSRPRSAPTRHEQHAANECPDCHTPLKGGWVKRRREVIELPLVPVEVVEHEYLARQCPLCGKECLPDSGLEGVVVGQGRLGLNLISLVVCLREEARMPLQAIKWYLKSVHGLKLSVGEIARLVQEVAKQAEPAVEEIKERIRASEVIGCDETGWREDGLNGYVWTFSTPTERYFVRGKRDKAMVDQVLGDDCRATLVSDFYAAYNHYPGLKQRCWAHLLRDIGELVEAHPKDEALQEWAQAVHKVYQQAKAFQSDDEQERIRSQLEYEQRLLAVCGPYRDDPLAVQAGLCRRIERHIKELFVFVANPLVPADNNQAERSLRHLVTSRKISGGTRSRAGSDSKMVLASFFGTCRVRGLNPLLECRRLLSPPQV